MEFSKKKRVIFRFRNMKEPMYPVYLFEFDDYEKTNMLVFDGELSKEDYLELTNLFTGLTTGMSIFQ